MELSEAIRLGAMLRPQAFTSDGVHGSCALRAAADALGVSYRTLHEPVNYGALERLFPFLRADEESCPVCEFGDRTLVILYHLNDAHRWTREQIADWVATIETAAASDRQQTEVTV